MKACNDLLLWAKEAIREEDASVLGFNVGVIIGRGGVRHVILGKGNY